MNIKISSKNRHYPRKATFQMGIIDELFACELNEAKVTDEYVQKMPK